MVEQVLHTDVVINQSVRLLTGKINGFLEALLIARCVLSPKAHAGYIAVGSSQTHGVAALLKVGQCGFVFLVGFGP